MCIRTRREDFLRSLEEVVNACRTSDVLFFMFACKQFVDNEGGLTLNNNNCYNNNDTKKEKRERVH